MRKPLRSPFADFARLLVFAICLGLPAANAAQTNAQFVVGNSKIDLVFTSTAPEPLRPIVLNWISAAARAVTTFMDSSPWCTWTSRVSLDDGHGAEPGQASGSDGALITVSVGRSSTASDLARSWLMTHEMVHLAFPSVTGSITGLKKASRPTWSLWPGARWRTFRPKTFGEIWCAACRKACHNRGIEGSIFHPYLGQYLLGRRTVLFARRHRDPQTGRQ